LFECRLELVKAGKEILFFEGTRIRPVF